MATAAARGGLSGAGVAVLVAAAFVVSVGYGAILPVLPAWLALLEPSLSAAEIAEQVGELSGVYMLGFFVGALAAGSLSDRAGRRPVLLAGLILFLVALLATVHVESLASLYALRFLAGLFGSAVVPVSAAMIADGSVPGRAARRLAYLGAASLLGFLGGPAIIALPQLVGADVRWGISGPDALATFALDATFGLGIVVLVAAFRVRPVAQRAPSVMKGDSTTSDAARFSLLALLALNFAVLLGLGGFEVGLAVYGSQRLRLDASRIGLVFAECGAVMLLVNGLLFLTPLSRRITVRTVLVLSTAAMAGGFILLYRSTGYGSVAAAVALIAAGAGAAMPTIVYATATATHARRLGAAMGQLTAAGSLGQAAGSFAGGWMFALLSARTFLAGALFMLLALLLAWLGLRSFPIMLGPGERAALDPAQRPR